MTGGAQGIGYAVARAFLQQGARVTIADIVQEPLAQACAALQAAFPDRVRSASLDVTDEAATATAMDEAAEARGGLDVVVANAGILVLKRAVDLDLAAWRRVIDINLTGAFLTATTAARRMLAQRRGGRIILTSSLFGLIGLMQCLAAELGPAGIRVNCVCPGQIDTAMMERLFTERAAERRVPAAELKAAFESRIPLRRLGQMDEIAGTFVYLASDLSGYVTGQSVVSDGGWQVG